MKIDCVSNRGKIVNSHREGVDVKERVIYTLVGVLGFAVSFVERESEAAEQTRLDVIEMSNIPQAAFPKSLTNCD